MTRLDRQLEEAAQLALPQFQCPARQLWLGMAPFFVESIGFIQVCHFADTIRHAISHQHRMYYREEFNIWYATIDAYLREQQVPVTIRAFLTDSIWNDYPPQIERFWFPSMREIVFLTYIAEERGYPVWTAKRCEAFHYKLDHRTGRSSRRKAKISPAHKMLHILQQISAPSQPSVLIPSVLNH